MLKDIDLPTLQDRRTNAKLVFLYKVVEGLVPAIDPDMFIVGSASLKHLTVFARAVSSGSLFQLTIVSTKNEFLYWVVFETGTANDLVLFVT
jgi:hypothetical protein